jgi:Rieske Fe-S protein
MQEKTMKSRRTILTLMGTGAAGALALTSISPAAAQTATSSAATSPSATSAGVIAAPAPGAKKPTTATPAMIDEASQRSQARTAKAAPTPTTAAKPEQFGSEEPFTYKPGATAN